MRLVLILFLVVFSIATTLCVIKGKEFLEKFELIFRVTFFSSVLLFVLFTIVYSFVDYKQASDIFTHLIEMLKNFGGQ
jgi:hypothetical protein